MAAKINVVRAALKSTLEAIATPAPPAAVWDEERPSKEITTYPELQVVFIEAEKINTDDAAPLGRRLEVIRFVIKQYTRPTGDADADAESIDYSASVEEALETCIPGSGYLGVLWVRSVRVTAKTLRNLAQEGDRVKKRLMLIGVEVLHAHDRADARE